MRSLVVIYIQTEKASIRIEFSKVLTALTCTCDSLFSSEHCSPIIQSTTSHVETGNVGKKENCMTHTRTYIEIGLRISNIMHTSSAN